MESDLVLIRSFPGSFYHPVIFGTPSDHIAMFFFYVHKTIETLTIFWTGMYQCLWEDAEASERAVSSRYVLLVIADHTWGIANVFLSLRRLLSDFSVAVTRNYTLK